MIGLAVASAVAAGITGGLVLSMNGDARYNAYRETLSVPLIVSNPRLYPRAQTTDAFAGLIDIVPTLTTIGGVPEPQRFDLRGRDLAPILTNPTASVQDFLHFTYEDAPFPVTGANCIRAIVEPDWKYAVYYDPFTGAAPEYEMYDLARDRLEMTNLAHPVHRTPQAAAEQRRLHARLTQVMTDNGPCYLSADFKHAIRAVGAEHIRTRPYTPQTNGKAERLIRTLLQEWAYAQAYRSSHWRTSALERYLNYYNGERRHSALGVQPPFARLAERL